MKELLVPIGLLGLLIVLVLIAHGAVTIAHGFITKYERAVNNSITKGEIL